MLTMALRASFRPLRPDLDNFLFAAVGGEQDGIPLSMVSMLARLGLDPWEEAGRLSSLSKREAVEQLARLIAELPGASRLFPEAREIAGGLVEQLPRHDNDRPPPLKHVRRRFRWPSVPQPPRFLLFCAVVAVAALASIILRSGLPWGLWSP